MAKKYTEEQKLEANLKKRERDRLRQRRLRLENPEKVREANRRDYAKHRESRMESHKTWMENNPTNAILWEAKNKLKRNEERKLRARRRRLENPLAAQEEQARWRENNPEKVTAWLQATAQRRNARRKERLDTEPLFKLSVLLRDRLGKAIKNNQKRGSAIRDMGCSVDHLKAHLESLFELGMEWSNWGHGKGKWHIDHIMPLDAFDLSNLQHFVLANHYLNLRPLWSEENFRKSSKLPILCENQSYAR